MIYKYRVYRFHLFQIIRSISTVFPSIRKYLAVAERGNLNEKPRIYVYSLETLTRKITLGIPFEINTQEIMCLTFTHDNDYIAALTAGPDYMMYYYNWKNGKIESQARANNPPSIPGPVTDVNRFFWVLSYIVSSQAPAYFMKFFLYRLNRWQ